MLNIRTFAIVAGLALATPSIIVTANGQNAGPFIVSQTANQWTFVKFRGVDVLAPNGNHIGDVNDLLFDKDGKILALIIGVGGFLGIGEKNIAIPFQEFELVRGGSGRHEDVKLNGKWTNEQLKAAPEFQYRKNK